MKICTPQSATAVGSNSGCIASAQALRSPYTVEQAHLASYHPYKPCCTTASRVTASWHSLRITPRCSGVGFTASIPLTDGVHTMRIQPHPDRGPPTAAVLRAMDTVPTSWHRPRSHAFEPHAGLAPAPPRAVVSPLPNTVGSRQSMRHKMPASQPAAGPYCSGAGRSWGERPAQAPCCVGSKLRKGVP